MSRPNSTYFSAEEELRNIRMALGGLLAFGACAFGSLTVTLLWVAQPETISSRSVLDVTTISMLLGMSLGIVTVMRSTLSEAFWTAVSWVDRRVRDRPTEVEDA